MDLERVSNDPKFKANLKPTIKVRILFVGNTILGMDFSMLHAPTHLKSAPPSNSNPPPQTP